MVSAGLVASAQACRTAGHVDEACVASPGASWRVQACRTRRQSTRPPVTGARGLLARLGKPDAGPVDVRLVGASRQAGRRTRRHAPRSARWGSWPASSPVMSDVGLVERAGLVVALGSWSMSRPDTSTRASWCALGPRSSRPGRTRRRGPRGARWGPWSTSRRSRRTVGSRCARIVPRPGGHVDAGLVVHVHAVTSDSRLAVRAGIVPRSGRARRTVGSRCAPRQSR